MKPKIKQMLIPNNQLREQLKLTIFSFRSFIFLFAFLFAVIFNSCKSDVPAEQVIDISHGVFIINEGNFMSNNGEISFYNIQTGEMLNNLFASQNNNAVLGDVVQSMCMSDTLAVISVNNSKKTEIVNLKNFKHIKTISGFSYPRHIISVRENICYLTNGKNPGEVKVIDLNKGAAVKTITVGNQPENLILLNDKVFIADGAWGHDSTISIVDALTDEFIETTTIGDGTTDLCADKNGNIWILCQGKSIIDYPEETASQLVCINPETYEILERVIIGTIGDDFNPIRIASDNERGYVYYVEKPGVYRINIDNPQQKEWFIMGSYYGLDINPENGDVYVFYDSGFTGAGIMTIYNSEGNKIQDLIKVGIGPNGAVFK